MNGKLCVTRVGKEFIEGYFIAPKREEYVRIKSEMINIPVSPGQVLRIDYSWRSIAVFETLEDKFFEVEPEVTETVKFQCVQIADSQEEAERLVRERLEKDYPRMKAGLEPETISFNVN